MLALLGGIGDYLVLCYLLLALLQCPTARLADSWIDVVDKLGSEYLR